jgi:crotonobetainyl-CoA:carnitine CoA-transferase CaiB-like acyl-CoA transferase
MTATSSYIPAAQGALADVRVVDLTSVIMGPYASQILADLGADVVCVEAAGGDTARFLGAGAHPQLGGTALNLLRNKRNVALDLKHPDGHAAFLKLVATADILLTNLRPGPRQRLAITYEDIRKVRPDIIYCHAQGWATDTGRADDPAYDDAVQAAGGVSDLLLRQNGVPGVSPTVIGDKLAGLAMVYTVLAALHHRTRTGEGQCIEVPMVDAMAAFVLVEHGHDAIQQPPAGGPGYPRLTSRDRAPLPTRDGYVQIVPYSREHWAGLLAVGGAADAIDDPRLATMASRNAHAEALYAELVPVMKLRTTAEWMAWCHGVGMACAAMATLDDLVEALPLAEHPITGAYRHVPFPARLSATPASLRRPAPLPGQHNREVLAEAGLTDADIAALERSGALIDTTRLAK